MVKPKHYSKFYEKGLLSKRGSDLAVRFSFNKDTSTRENNNSLIPLGDISYKDTTSKAQKLACDKLKMKFIHNPKWHANINSSEPSKVIFQKYIKWIQILPGQPALYRLK